MNSKRMKGNMRGHEKQETRNMRGTEEHDITGNIGYYMKLKGVTRNNHKNGGRL